MTLPDAQSLLLGAVSRGCFRPEDLPSGCGLGVMGRDSAHCPVSLIKVPGTVEPTVVFVDGARSGKIVSSFLQPTGPASETLQKLNQLFS